MEFFLLMNDITALIGTKFLLTDCSAVIVSVSCPSVTLFKNLPLSPKLEFQRVGGGANFCSGYQGHITKTAAMPAYGNTLYCIAFFRA